jgi:hypothetical protein
LNLVVRVAISCRACVGACFPCVGACFSCVGAYFFCVGACFSCVGAYLFCVGACFSSVGAWGHVVLIIEAVATLTTFTRLRHVLLVLLGAVLKFT